MNPVVLPLLVSLSLGAHPSSALKAPAPLLHTEQSRAIDFVYFSGKPGTWGPRRRPLQLAVV